MASRGSHTAARVCAMNRKTAFGGKLDLVRLILLVVIILLISSSPAWAKDWYVGPSGLTTNPGTIDVPWDMASAFMGNNGQVQPGDTIYMLAGTYRSASLPPPFDPEYGSQVVVMSGTAAAPITIRPYPGAHVRIDGGVDRGYNSTVPEKGIPSLECNFVIIRDLEMWSTEWANPIHSNQTGPWPSDIPSYHGGGCAGRQSTQGGNKVINCDIHNAFGGLDSWMEEANFEAHGNIVYKIGWTAPDRGHGHPVYTQNGSPFKIYSNNIFMNQYDGTLCMQAYGSGLATIDHYLMQQNIAQPGGGFAGDFLVGGGGFSDDNHLIGNITYGSAMWAGYTFSTQNGAYEVRDNYIVNNDLTYWRLDSLTQSNNTVINGKIWTYPYPQGPPWDDGHAVQGINPPTQSQVFVLPNKYDSLRGNLVIFNWANASTVQVDFHGLVPANSGFKLMNPYNFYGTPVFTGTADATGKASIPTPAQFNLFVVQVNGNLPPAVTMPANIVTAMPGAATAGAVALNATVSDDGQVSPVVVTWSVLSAPANGTVNFTNANAASTTAGFNRMGTYTLQLDANDGALETAATMTVTVQVDPRADFDNNGVVDGLDFLAWQRNYNHGTAASGAPILDANFNDPNYAKANGDANGDGKVDGQDYLIWQQDYVYGH